MPVESHSGTVVDASSRHPKEGDYWQAYRLLDSRQRVQLGGLMIARIAVGFFDLLLATAMYFVFLLLQGTQPMRHAWWQPRTLLMAAITTAVLIIVRSFSDIVSTRALIQYVQDIYTDLLLRLTRGYNEVRWASFVETNRSELLNHTTYTAREAANFYLRGIELIAAQVVVGMMAVAVIYESPFAAVGLGVTILLFYGAHRFLIRNRLQVTAARRERSVGVLQKILADMFASGKEIRTYGSQDFFQNRIREHAESVGTSSVRLALLPQLTRILSDQGVLLAFLGVVIVVQIRHSDMHQLLSVLVFYFVLSRRLLPLVSLISLLAGQMDGSYENVRLVIHELDRCLKQRSVLSASPLPDGDAVMDLRLVSFWFESGKPILRDVSIRQRRGETIILHGVSGSGKSSLLNLLAGILQPVSGTVCVDRAKIAYVPQETVLLDESVRTNLLFGLEEKSDEELMKALRIAQLDAFVSSQPNGLDARAGDNGVLFSGGQRQRLGIARAILRGATFLLLDEATSALDEQNELRILQNLADEGLAVLLVTHRMNSRVAAHRTFILEGCELVEDVDVRMPIFEQTSDPILSGA
jgi:ABC-type multidrug transport system fused ATPase/permease subunit